MRLEIKKEAEEDVIDFSRLLQHRICIWKDNTDMTPYSHIHTSLPLHGSGQRAVKFHVPWILKGTRDEKDYFRNTVWRLPFSSNFIDKTTICSQGHTLNRSASYYTHTHTQLRDNPDNLMCVSLDMVKTSLSFINLTVWQTGGQPVQLKDLEGTPTGPVSQANLIMSSTLRLVIITVKTHTHTHDVK